MVRGADTGRLDLAPEAAGLHAVSLGISAAKDDQADLMQGIFLCDAL
ncbi:MAG: chromate resistance protein ChrB domain-containing protein [Pseudomonadota bacterium]|nr:chromate resistance protein ChrB domain-containing protein [Pseudomonadota bacterium]